MRTIETKVYKFEELSEQSKERAIQQYRETPDFLDDFILDDAKAIAEKMGIDIDKIFYSGFSQQGSGASYTGRYSYKKGAIKALKAYCNDEEIFRIAKELQEIQRRNFYKLSAKIGRSGHYQHEMTMNFDFYKDGEYLYTTMAFESDLKKVLRDFARWIHKQLEAEYDYQNSDEYITDMIVNNNYEFTEEGEMI